MALGGRGRGSHPSGSPEGWGQGSDDSHLALDGSGWGQRAAPLGPAGPGTSGSRRRLKGGDAQLSPGVFFWIVVGSSKKRDEAWEGSRTHPQAQTRLRLGAPGWGGAGLGEGERDSQGCSSSGLLRRPRQCRGRGSRRREGKRGRGRAGPTPHASTRTALAHSQITARPAGCGAQAQGERPRGVRGEAVLGLGGPRRDIPGRRERYGVEVGAGASGS